jgi:hypothetical protein
MTRKIPKQEYPTIVRLYREELVPIIIIASKYGVTPRSVYKLFKKLDVDTSKATWGSVEVKCAWCEKPLKRKRCEIRKTARTFCNRDCYNEWLVPEKEYVRWAYGMRLARELIKEKIGEIPEGAVGHHVDNDNTNNRLENLELYASQGDHIRAHRGFHVEPIWRGEKYWRKGKL